MITLPHDSIVAVLRASGVQGIVWGEDGSPYYQKAPDPLPDDPYPFVVYDIPKNNGPAHTFQGAPRFNEEIKVIVRIVGTREQIRTVGTPYSFDAPSTSVLGYLDSLQGSPSVFNGDTFACGGWKRAGWDLKLEEYQAAETAQRIYTLEAEYVMLINAQYP